MIVGDGLGFFILLQAEYSFLQDLFITLKKKYTKAECSAANDILTV